MGDHGRCDADGGDPTRNDDEITTYSSKGPSAIDHIVKPDLVAPGNLIDSEFWPPAFCRETFSADMSWTRSLTTPGPSSPPNLIFLNLSGTSMAAAVTSGAVAVLLDSESKLTPDQVKARLMLTAYKNFRSNGTFYFDYSVKAKKLNLAARRASLAVTAFQDAVTDAQKPATDALTAWTKADDRFPDSLPRQRSRRRMGLKFSRGWRSAGASQLCRCTSSLPRSCAPGKRGE